MGFSTVLFKKNATTSAIFPGKDACGVAQTVSVASTTPTPRAVDEGFPAAYAPRGSKPRAWARLVKRPSTGIGAPTVCVPENLSCSGVNLPVISDSEIDADPGNQHVWLTVQNAIMWRFVLQRPRHLHVGAMPHDLGRLGREEPLTWARHGLHNCPSAQRHRQCCVGLVAHDCRARSDSHHPRKCAGPHPAIRRGVAFADSHLASHKTRKGRIRIAKHP